MRDVSALHLKSYLQIPKQVWNDSSKPVEVGKKSKKFQSLLPCDTQTIFIGLQSLFIPVASWIFACPNNFVYHDLAIIKLREMAVHNIADYWSYHLTI